MVFNKHNGKIFRVDFSTKEQEAIDKEIGHMIAEANRKNAANFDALVLYALYAHYGWEKDQLREFWMGFCQEHKELCDRYEMYGVGDNTWLAKKKLEEIGVDVTEWYKELEG